MRKNSSTIRVTFTFRPTIYVEKTSIPFFKICYMGKNKKNILSIKKQLKLTLVKDIRLLFKKLLDIISYESEKFNELILLNCRLVELNEEYRNDTIALEDKKRELNKLRLSLLKLIDQIPKEELLID